MKPPKRIIPRKLSQLTPEELRKHEAVSRLAIRRRVQQRRAERGKLADFKLFKLIATVAWLPRAKPPRATGRDQVDAEAQHDWASLAKAKPLLAHALITAVIDLDSDTLERVAATVDHLRQYRPRANEQFAPLNREHVELLKYFAEHKIGTIEQLLKWMGRRMSWDVKDDRLRYDKRIRRACERLNLSIAHSQPGPTRGSKQIGTRRG